MPADLQILAQQPHDGEAYWFLDALSVIKLSGEQTGGAFTLIEDHLPAQRATPYHRHEREDETFYLLEGQMQFFSGSRQFVAGPGTTVFLPRGVPHGFRSLTPGRMLILASPAGFDSFVRAVGDPAASLEIPARRPPDFEKLTLAAAAHGIEILGPLPE